MAARRGNAYSIPVGAQGQAGRALGSLIQWVATLLICVRGVGAGWASGFLPSEAIL